MARNVCDPDFIGHEYLLSYFREIKAAKLAILDKSIPYQVFVGALSAVWLRLVGALYIRQLGIGNIDLRLLLGGAAV